MPTPLETAIAAAREEDYLRAMTLFLDIYGTEDAPPIRTPKDASGLSFFGLTLALMQRKFKPAIDLCKRAIELEFYNGDHYANLARVYVAAGNRKRALETLEQGLKLVPGHDYLTQVRTSMGVRSRPAVPFLDRSHPINVTLGQSRHAKKVSEKERKK
ncbi:MAG TPA: tetratricopeptide repeat protein [Thermoanaerobaculia bacterium]|nr:tetratricopeptide repeat protein [Thermoanaerobaculia bacterium]